MLSQEGQTALILAANGGHASVVTLLLDAKADVDHFEQVSVWDMACKFVIRSTMILMKSMIHET